jgi:transcriptional regulator with XRE-family HTH domain
MEDIITKIQKKAKARGLSQERVAQEIGVSFQTVNRWFHGKSKRMHHTTVMAIETFLDRDAKQ